jgi:hypothetical protein
LLIGSFRNCPSVGTQPVRAARASECAVSGTDRRTF